MILELFITPKYIHRTEDASIISKLMYYLDEYLSNLTDSMYIWLCVIACHEIISICLLFSICADIFLVIIIEKTQGGASKCCACCWLHDDKDAFRIESMNMADQIIIVVLHVLRSNKYIMCSTFFDIHGPCHDVNGMM